MAERLVKNITSDYLTCSICCCVFKDPKMLYCGHSYCSPCLEDYVTSVLRARDSFECPICRSKYDLQPNTEPKSWITGLRTDDISLSILRAIGQHERQRSQNSEDRGQDLPDDVGLVNDHEFNINSVCARHFDKKLDVYCEKHDIVVCSECAWRDHKEPGCNCVSAAKVINKRYNSLKCVVAQQVADASQLTNAQENGQRTVEQLHDDIQRSITDVEDSFKEICAAFTNRIQSLRIKAKQTVECDPSIAAIKAIQSRLVHQIKSFDDATSTMNPNETMRHVAEMCCGSSEMQENIHELSLKINSGSLMKYAEADLNQMDAFVSSAKQTLPEDFVPYDEIDDDDECDDKDFVLITKSGQFDLSVDATHDVLELKRQFTFSAKLEGEETCMLSGIALIGTVAVVVVDQKNRSLKKFKVPEGKFLNDLVIRYEPHQITSIKETNMVAVTVWDVPKILIVGTDPVLEILRVVNTDYEYIGVVSNKLDCIAASSINGRRVDLLDIRPSNIQDPKLGTIYQSSRTRSLPDRLTSTKSGNVVVRTRHRNEISCFGGCHLLWARRLKSSISDVTCFRGKIFATLSDKDDIVYFGEDGMGELGSLKDERYFGIKRPWSMDAFKDCLVVTEDSPSDLIHLLVF